MLMNIQKFILLILVILSVFLISCSKKPICGDKVVEAGETMQTCCQDTGCLGEQTCQSSQCIDPNCGECQYLESHVCKNYGCCNNEDCSNTQICENHACKEISCGTCDYIENHNCIKAKCCSNSDCNDNNQNSIDRCLNAGTENAKCSFREKEDFAIIESDVPLEYQSQVIEKFYGAYDDDYDFLVIYTDFDYSGNIHGGGTGLKPIEGIAQPSYDSPMGSKGKLRSTAFMGDIRKKFEGMIEEIYPTTANGILHEIGHYWCCYVNFKDWNSIESDKLLQGSIHWHDQLLDVGTNDPMGGRYSWNEISSGTYKGTEREYMGKVGHFSELTLYLMGFIPKEDVMPVKLVVPREELTYEGNNLIVNGEMYIIKIEDIISIEGERNPTNKESQKDFKVGFILWTRDKSHVSEDTKNKVNRMRKMFEEQWYEATNGLSSIKTDLV